MEKENQTKVEIERKRLKKEKALVVIGCLATLIGGVCAVAGIVLLVINIFSDIGSFILYGVLCVVGFLLFAFGCIYAKPVIKRFTFKDNKFAKTYSKEEVQNLEQISNQTNNGQHQENFCPVCGEKLAEGAVFCSKCGSKLEQ